MTAFQVLTIPCPNCGASTQLAPGQVAAHCLHCLSDIRLSEADARKMEMAGLSGRLQQSREGANRTLARQKAELELELLRREYQEDFLVDMERASREISAEKERMENASIAARQQGNYYGCVGALVVLVGFTIIGGWREDGWWIGGLIALAGGTIVRALTRAAPDRQGGDHMKALHRTWDTWRERDRAFRQRLHDHEKEVARFDPPS